jgi:glycosyltransferase involved in cell wall biosynthesis
MEANCNVPVFVAGNQRHPSGSQHAFEENGNEWRASVGGRQSDLQLMQLYSRASIYAATSCYEPFGLAPTEAALSRCALLCNDIPVFHELWGDSAVFFKRDDAHSLREQIELLHSDGEARREYANRAYHHARERFNAAKMVDDYVALYRSFVSAEVAA